jgi:hypothetical protein
MDSVERKILAPALKFLTTEEAANWLGVREELFAEMMKHHSITPVPAWKGKHVWHWQTVFFAEELLKVYKGA